MGGVKIAFKYKFDIPIADQDNAIYGKSDTICESTHKYGNFSNSEFKQNKYRRKNKQIIRLSRSIMDSKDSCLAEDVNDILPSRKNTIFTPFCERSVSI